MINIGVSNAMQFLRPLLAAILLALTSPGAHGTLLGRDINGNPTASNTDPSAVFEYDTDLNITWLRDWNYALTNGFDADGKMDWSTAVAWAAGLSVGSYTGWRLPTTDTTASSNCDSTFDPGFGFPLQYLGANCTGSEMGHVWYIELGNTAASFTNSAPFINMQVGLFDAYWSGTTYAPENFTAWLFVTQNFNSFGGQAFGGKGAHEYAVAVRPGDVATTVSEPATIALAGLALAAVGFSRRCSR